MVSSLVRRVLLRQTACHRLTRCFTTESAGPRFGAFLDNVDLTTSTIDLSVAEAVRSALLKHKVIALRPQRFDQAKDGAAASLANAARSLFGPDLQPMSADGTKFVQMYISEGGRKSDLNSDWFHSDLSYMPVPSSVTMLWATETPPGPAGDTVFLDAVRAYKALPAELRKEMQNRVARHDVRTSQQQTSELNAVHPVVRPHPVSGKRAVFVSPGYTSHIEGDDGSLLREIFKHCDQEEFKMRYSYQPGDLVIWDNAAVWHKATTMDLPEGSRRVMMRVSVLGGQSGNWWPAAPPMSCPVAGFGEM